MKKLIGGGLAAAIPTGALSGAGTASVDSGSFLNATEWFSSDLHQLRMERNAILWAIEVLTKNQELAIKHLPPLYSTPTIGPERGEKT